MEEQQSRHRCDGVHLRARTVDMLRQDQVAPDVCIRKAVRVLFRCSIAASSGKKTAGRSAAWVFPEGLYHDGHKPRRP